MISDLGGSISTALQSLFKGQVTDEAIEDSLKEICTLLVKHNVNPKLVVQFRALVKDQLTKKNLEKTANKAKLVHQAFFECLVKFLDPVTKPYDIQRGKGTVVVFVGLQGCGKTTTVCKYANFYKKKSYRVGIVCADTFRAGAFDQVRQNASKIGIPYYGSDDVDPVQVARKGVHKFKNSDFDLILVDTSGRHTQEEALFSEMREMVAAISPDNIVFVMDAGIGQSAEEQATGFRNAVKVGGIVLTKLDGASKAGGALSSVAATQCPIEFVGIGENMDDLEKFDAKRFVGRMLGMGDLDGLVEKLSQIDVDQEVVVEKLATGKFRLIDFKNIFTQIMSLGPISKMLEMIPGMKDLPIADENKIRKIGYIFDSMSRGELESNGEPFLKNPERMSRVARGAGVAREFVSETLGTFRQMSSMMKKMMANPMFASMLQGTQSEDDRKKMMKGLKGKVPNAVLNYMDSLN